MTRNFTVENLFVDKKKKNYIYPRYDGYSLYNAIETIFNLFNISNLRKPLDLDIGNYANKNNKVVFFLIDGFGYRLYEKLLNSVDLLKILSEKKSVAPITSGFPSTTAASLTTVFTGLTPQEHGLFEWNLYLKELDEIIQTLPFSFMGKTAKSDGVLEIGGKPEMLINKPTIFETLNRHRIKSFVFSHESIAESVYSKASAKGAKKVSYRYLSDLIISLKKLLAEPGPSFLYVYWSGVDSQEHRFGPKSEETLLESKIFFDSLYKGLFKKLRREKIKNTLFLMTADHGQIAMNPKKTIYVNGDSKLMSYLATGKNGKKILPFGSARDVFLKVEENKINDSLKYLKSFYGRYAEVFKTETLFKGGLFGVGSPSREFLQRMGNIVLLPYNGNTIWYEHVNGEQLEFKGHHGGLTRDEMVIPFALASFEELI